MAVTKITNLEFGKMVQAAADKLGKNAEFINSLNVFPVPDGDTGTNMTSSMASGAKYERNETSKRVGDLSAALAKGLLMGARGNSVALQRQQKAWMFYLLLTLLMLMLMVQRQLTRL